VPLPVDRCCNSGAAAANNRMRPSKHGGQPLCSNLPLRAYRRPDAAAGGEPRRGAIAPHRGRALYLRGLQLLPAAEARSADWRSRTTSCARVHVDYWTTWAARPLRTARGGGAAASVRAHADLPSIYTPQLVIDGQRDLSAVAPALGAPAAESPACRSMSRYATATW